jgi:hypothetical protein
MVKNLSTTLHHILGSANAGGIRQGRRYSSAATPVSIFFSQGLQGREGRAGTEARRKQRL